MLTIPCIPLHASAETDASSKFTQEFSKELLNVNPTFTIYTPIDLSSDQGRSLILQTEKQLKESGYNNILNHSFTRYAIGNGVYQYDFRVTYRESKQQMDWVSKRCRQIVRKVRNKSDYTKAAYINKWINNHIRYSIPTSSTQISAYYVLKYKQTSCMGYSCLFKELASAAGLKSWIVIGSASKSNPDSSRHAWNIVKVNGRYYYIDTCWSGWKDKYFLFGKRLCKKERILEEGCVSDEILERVSYKNAKKKQKR